MNDSSARSPLIKLVDIERVFETGAGTVCALSNISISIHAGEFVCITGPSGSGKSTLLNIMGCLDRPSAGSYIFSGSNADGMDGRELARLRRLAFGFVFQHYGLLDSMTALRNVELPAEYAGISMQERNRRAVDILRSLGLDSRKTHLPTELSGGEQQRVAIARALMNGRRIILADEPTGALDSCNSEQILSLFQQLASRGHTVVMVSHDAAVADAAERQIELLDGAVARDSGAYRRPSGRASNASTVREKKQSFLASMTQALRTGVDSLRAARLRTALQIGGPVLGVASAIALLGFANGTYQATLKVVGSLGADRIDVSVMPLPGTRSINPDDARSIEGLARVREVALSQYESMFVRYGNRTVEEVDTFGTQDLPSFMKTLWPLAAGRYATRQDGENLSQMVVIDNILRDQFFTPDEEPLGEWIDINGVPFEIIGVLAPHPIMQQEPYSSRASFPPSVFIPFATAREVLFGDEITMSVSAYAKDAERVEEAASDIRDVLIRRLGHEDFMIVTDRQVFGVYRDSVRNRVSLLIGIAVPSLLTGAVVTMALMLGAIRQRAREIAIRMAVGARRSDIFRQFMGETCLITLLAIALGVPLGLFAGYAASVSLNSPSAHEPWYIWAAGGAALASALLSGILPALRASALNPATALARE